MSVRYLSFTSNFLNIRAFILVQTKGFTGPVSCCISNHWGHAMVPCRQYFKLRVFQGRCSFYDLSKLHRTFPSGTDLPCLPLNLHRPAPSTTCCSDKFQRSTTCKPCAKTCFLLSIFSLATTSFIWCSPVFYHRLCSSSPTLNDSS